MRVTKDKLSQGQERRKNTGYQKSDRIAKKHRKQGKLENNPQL
jgi:hypothetical protein